MPRSILASSATTSESASRTRSCWTAPSVRRRCGAASSCGSSCPATSWGRRSCAPQGLMFPHFVEMGEHLGWKLVRMKRREERIVTNFRCVLKELETLGKDLYGAKLIAQKCQVRNCPHFKNAVSGSQCLLSMVEEGNPHHYFVATQDQNLSMKVKRKAGVPLMFIIQNTMVLDKPSPKTIAFVKAVESGQLVSVHEKESIKHLKEEQGLVKNPEQRRRKKRKKISGPNPLSCLKKKKKAPDTQSSASEKKRKRKRIRNRSNSKVLSEKQNAEGE
ncbi:rRNA-processing protein UTP23 homolog isoform X1 [Symphalangus syndactylus]|uniref:rRNA-processing protein UTP23 homolog isoform X1 n=1 Tax=Symphalangus syndactylus TaxID=9590 RepID=UPI0024417934|nr:rRNA-processing protein UTP23 homolog isoform X1 [Symphalangus syndactylus]